jgi:hypothetical protein
MSGALSMLFGKSKWLILSVLLVSAGCGGVDLFEADAPPVTITGSVYYRNYQLPNGWVVFSADPDFGAGTDTLMVPISRNGTFQAYDGKQWGLKPGYYRIAVSCQSSNGWSLPSKYANPATSGLKCMIRANQPLRIRLELD